jgi:hypothetical protein
LNYGPLLAWISPTVYGKQASFKDKVYYFIDMAITHHKTKKAFAK